MKPLRWPLHHGAITAYSVAADNCWEDAPRAAWLSALNPKICWSVPQQVHGVTIAAAPAATRPVADGLVSLQPFCGLVALGADCPGLAVSTPKGLGIAHCGWRGTAAGIVRELLQALARAGGGEPSQWQALVGPGICAGCYEVGGELLSARAWPPGTLSRREGRDFLDLPGAIRADLEAGGLHDILLAGVCTRCDPRLNSFRKTGVAQSQALALWREPG